MNLKEINKNFDVLIPLRKGSRRIKFKNFVKVKNKPLVYFTVKEAIKIFNNENIYISSNDLKAKTFSKKYNLKFIKRPNELCTDTSKTEEAVLHFLNHQKKNKSLISKNLIILQATSPLRTSKDILESIVKFKKKKLDSLFSVYSEKSFIWKRIKKKFQSISFDYRNRKMSQVMEKVYFENGAIFIFNKIKFLKFKNRIFGKFDIYEMDKSKSIDIDEVKDLEKLKKILRDK